MEPAGAERHRRAGRDHDRGGVLLTSGGRESINFFAELKRRNIYKVAFAYAVVGWLLVQVATQVFFEIPNWMLLTIIFA